MIRSFVRMAAVLACLSVILPGALNLAPAHANTIPVGGYSVQICGLVTQYIPSTATQPGTLTISTTTFSIAPNATISGAATVTTVNSYCLAGMVDGTGQLVSGSLIPTGTTFTGSGVCGALQAYVPASTTLSGYLAIGNQIIATAPGSVIIIPAGLGTLVCLTGVFNNAGQLVTGTVTTGTTVSPTNGCGTVSAYVAPTATSAGILVLGTQSFVLAPGAVLSGSGTIAVGANICLTGALNGLNQITSGTVTSNSVVPVTICGAVSAYTAPTATAAGSIIIAGVTFPIAAFTSLSTAITAGSNICLNAQFQGGQIVSATVSGNGNGITAIIGAVSGYVPPTASTTGKIVIAGTAYPIAAGIQLSFISGVPLSATLVTATRFSAGGGFVE